MSDLKIIVVSIGLATYGLSVSAAAQNSITAFVPGELIVGYKSQSDRDNAVESLKAGQNNPTVRGQQAESTQIQPVSDTAVKLRFTLPEKVRADAASSPEFQARILREVATQIKADNKNVRYVHPNWILNIDPLPPHTPLDMRGLSNIVLPQGVQSPGMPNDPAFLRGLLWHYKAPPEGMNAIGAWQITKGDRSVVVAVIDTGILFNHPDIQGFGNVLPGFNFITKGAGRSSDATDAGDACPPASPYPSWHGTHVAGTIGAVGSNNGRAITGINWNVSVLPVRVLGPCGGTIADIADAIRWAAGLPVEGIAPSQANTHPAQVINMSLGASGPCTEDRVGLLIDALDAARAKGSTVVVAAGNDSADVRNSYPSGCSGVISVSASDKKGQLAWYSNYGAVTVMAPGGDTRKIDESGFPPGVWSVVNVSSINPDGIEPLEGTSMAAPHVSGAIALALATHPNWRGHPDVITNNLKASASPIPKGACPHPCGSGQLDALKLLSQP